MKHSPGPFTRRSIPGHLFELLDSQRNPVLRIRGGMMPTLEDARLLTASAEMASFLRELAQDTRAGAWARGARAILTAMENDSPL